MPVSRFGYRNLHLSTAAVTQGDRRFAFSIRDNITLFDQHQQQRVLIARALYKKPKLLIMDEGTANIDEANEARIFQWLKLTGATILSISHKPTTILWADRVVYIAGGR